MKTSRYSDSQILNILKQAERYSRCSALPWTRHEQGTKNNCYKKWASQQQTKTVPYQTISTYTKTNRIYLTYLLASPRGFEPLLPAWEAGVLGH